MDEIFRDLSEGLGAAGPAGVILLLTGLFWLLARGDLRFGREYLEMKAQRDAALEQLKAERDARQLDRRLARQAVDDVEHVASLARDNS